MCDMNQYAGLVVLGIPMLIITVLCIIFILLIVNVIISL